MSVFVNAWLDRTQLGTCKFPQYLHMQSYCRVDQSWRFPGRNADLQAH